MAKRCLPEFVSRNGVECVAVEVCSQFVDENDVTGVEGSERRAIFGSS